MDQYNLWDLKRKPLSGKRRNVYELILLTKRSPTHLIISQKVRGRYLPNNKNTNNRGNSRNLKRKTPFPKKWDENKLWISFIYE